MSGPAPSTASVPADRAASRGPAADQTPPGTLATLRAILAKDLRVELRTLESVPAMAIFAVTVFVVFRFALDRTRLEGDLAAGVLVVTLLFAAILAINRVFVAEREQHGLEGLLLAPIERTAVLGAKVAALVIYLLAVQLVTVPAFAIFFLDDWPAALPATFGVLVLMDLGLATAGALIASMAVQTRARDLIVPLLLLPMLTPLVIGTASALGPILADPGPSFDRFATWLAVIGLYDMVVSLIAWAVFDYVVED
ncbi:MAG: heme exporter protein CcmB [Solirubrobacterales bacterium]